MSTKWLTRSRLPAIVIMIEVAVTVAIPMMVVLAATVLAVPKACKVSLSIMMGRNPMRSRIGRAAPISIVPSVAVSDYIPVAIDPKIIGTGAGGNDSNHARRGWGSDSHPDRNLRKNRSERKQGQGQYFLCHGDSTELRIGESVRKL